MADVNRTLSRAEWHAVGAFLAVLVAGGLLVRVAEDLTRHRRAVRAELSRARRRALDAEENADALREALQETRETGSRLLAERDALRADLDTLRADEGPEGDA